MSAKFTAGGGYDHLAGSLSATCLCDQWWGKRFDCRALLSSNWNDFTLQLQFDVFISGKALANIVL